MIHSLSLVLILSFTIIAVHVCAQDTTTLRATSIAGNGTLLPVFACTSNEGKPIAIDAKFNSSCNSCTCMANGGAICTEKGCLKACYDDQAKGYGLEESRYSGCYQYLCTPSGWSKPIQICASTGVATSTPTINPTKLPLSSTGVAAISSSSSIRSINATTQLPTTIPPVYACTSNEGNPIAVGAGYRGQCNHCTCAANSASICTKMFCLDPCYDDNGKDYALEQSRYDGCYQYVCTPSGWSKPIQICASTGMATSPPTNQPTNLPLSSTGSNNPTCQKICTPLCINGLECREDEMGCKKCVPKVTTNAPICPQNLCEEKCEFGCVADFDKCTYQCKEPRLGETVRTISFHLSVSVIVGGPIPDVRMVLILENLMREIATKATISSSSLVIYNKDFLRVEGRVNSRYGKWFIKIGFRAIQHPEGDERAQFVRKLKDIFGKVPTITTDEPMAHVYDATNSIGLSMEEEQTITEAKEFYEFQTCQDGRTITAEKQCEAVTFAVVAATSSSTSIPIEAIIAPILGGIILIAIIATALIIRRRRADTVKAIEGMNREMANFTPIEGEQRV